MSEHCVCPPRSINSAIAVVFIIFSVLFAPLGADHASRASGHRETAVVKAVRQAAPSVVNIRGEKRIASPGNPVEDDSPRRVNGMGTGVVIDSRGYVITNYHVVDGVQEIQVTLDKGERYIARLVARDPETDLAVIKIDCPRKLRVIELGSSADLMTGEPVIAVGNAYGYEHTVTRGIISSLHRAVQVSDAQYYADLIQTDASINPGNSGGALLNIDGEMIGIVVAVRAGAQGIGFAIPIDKAVEVATDLLASRNESQARHGMKIVQTAGNSREAYKVVEASATAGEHEDCTKGKANPAVNGVLVASVEENSPAAEAGVKPGDVVMKIDDAPVQNALDFHRALLEKSPGGRLAISLRRGGEAVDVQLTLAAADAAEVDRDLGWELLGMRFKRIDSQRFRSEFKSRYRGGLEITGVRPESPAAEQGIQVGDILVGMHIWETVSMDNLSYILKRPEINNNGRIKFFILRGNETLYGYMPLAMRSVPSR